MAEMGSTAVLAAPAEVSMEATEFSTDQVDLSTQSLASLRTPPGSSLSLAIDRVLAEGKSDAVVSAGFSSKI
jgi:fatty acid/phospholipid biosynthesis enzyme